MNCYNVNFKFTDASERRLIAHALAAERNLELLALGWKAVRGLGRMARAAARALAMLRAEARAAKVDYVAQ